MWSQEVFSVSWKKAPLLCLHRAVAASGLVLWPVYFPQCSWHCWGFTDFRALTPDTYWCMRNPKVSPAYDKRKSYKVMKEPPTILLCHKDGMKGHFRKPFQWHRYWGILSYGHLQISPWQSHCSLPLYYASARNLMCQGVHNLNKTLSQPTSPALKFRRATPIQPSVDLVYILSKLCWRIGHERGFLWGRDICGPGKLIWREMSVSGRSRCGQDALLGGLLQHNVGSQLSRSVNTCDGVVHGNWSMVSIWQFGRCSAALLWDALK